MTYLLSVLLKGPFHSRSVERHLLCFSKTCKVKKSDDLQERMSLLKKKLTSEAPLSFLVTSYKPKV